MKKLTMCAVLALSAAPVEVLAQDTTDPTGPRGITVAPLGGYHMQVHWTRSVDDVGVARYRVFRREGAGGAGVWPPPPPWMEVGGVETGTEFDDLSVMPETLYTYAVSAMDDAGNESHGGRYGSADEHYSTSLPSFAEASVEIRCPISPVQVGAPFLIERDLSFTPSTWGVQTAHTDFHIFSDMDTPYTANAFTGGAEPTRTRTHTASNPGVLHIYTENHIRWPGFPSGNAYPWGNPISETMVTSAFCHVVVIGSDPMRIEPAFLPDPTPGVAYSFALQAMGEIGPPYVWGVTHGGRLPPGLSIDRATGVISGTPSSMGSYAFTVVAEASGSQVGAGADAERTYVLTVGMGLPDAGVGDQGAVDGGPNDGGDQGDRAVGADAAVPDRGSASLDGGVDGSGEGARDASTAPGDSMAAPDVPSDATRDHSDSGSTPDEEPARPLNDGDEGCKCSSMGRSREPDVSCDAVFALLVVWGCVVARLSSVSAGVRDRRPVRR